MRTHRTLAKSGMVKVAVIIGLVPCLWAGFGAAGTCGGAGPCSCGDTVTHDYALKGDLGPCAEHGLNINTGVTLDCQGHVIRGPGSVSRYYGIYLKDGTTDVTVKNCAVEGFRHGMRLRAAFGNQITANKFRANGDFGKHVGYGIAVHRGSHENLFEGNEIYRNADEGIHFGDSHRNKMIDNRVYDNYRENIYLLRSNEGLFKDNTTSGGRYNSIYVKHSSKNRFENNTFNDRTARIRGDSHDNYFIDNDVIATGIDFQSYLEQGKNTYPTNNSVVGGTISGAKRCLSFDGAADNAIHGVTLNDCELEIASSFQGITQRNTSIGVRLDPSKLSLERNTSMSVGWSVDMSIEDATRSPAEGARVRCLNVRGELVFDATTGQNGEIPTQNVVEYTQTTDGEISYTPHTFHIETDHTESVRTVRVDRNKTISVTLPGT